MNGSKRSAKQDWYRGRGIYSLRGEMKFTIKKNKRYLRRKARRCRELPNGNGYRKLAKNKAWELVS